MTREWINIFYDEADAGGGDEAAGSGEGTPDQGSDLLGRESSPQPSWRDELPEDLRGHSSLQDFKDVGGLAKSFVHQQKLIGKNKIEAPNDKWTDDQWSDFYNSIGRPETPDKYTPVEPNLPEGVSVDEGSVKNALEFFHKIGLLDNQASAVLSYYYDALGNEVGKNISNLIVDRNEAENILRDEWKNDFDANLDISDAVLKRFGSEELISMLKASRMINSIPLIRMLHKIGTGMMDDFIGDTGKPSFVAESTTASNRLRELKVDKDFVSKLTDRTALGHKEAVEEWEALHKMASK